MEKGRTISISARRGLMAASVALALAAPCWSGPAAAADREHTIIATYIGQMNTLDPLHSDYGSTNFVISAIYDTLVTYKGTELTGSLASEFSYGDDARSISLTLRPDVKFHDGSPLTAKDVAYTLDRLKRLGVGIAALIESYDSTTITDDTHLTINLSKPNSLVLSALSKIYIVNSKLVEANKGNDDGQAWLQSNDAGSGPFTLRDQNNGVLVELFPDYWAPVADRPEAIVFRRIDESATRRDELSAGNIDVAFELADRDAAALANDPNVKVIPFKANTQAEIIFNTRFGPTADPKVRKALRMVYDYEGGLRAIRFNNGALANGPLPPLLNCRPELPPVKQDLEQAKALLAEAGASDIKLTMNFQPVFDTMKQEATLFQSNLREIGVSLELEPIAFPTYLQRLTKPETIPQMILLGDFAQFPDPGIMLIKGYKSDATGTNRPGYSNPEVDKLLDEALATADEAKRCELYRQLQVILDEDSVMIDMYSTSIPSAYRLGRLADLEASLLVTPAAPADFRLAKP